MNLRPGLATMPLVPAGGVRAGSRAAGAEAPPPRGCPRSPSRAAAFERRLAAAGRTAGLLLAARDEAGSLAPRDRLRCSGRVSSAAKPSSKAAWKLSG